MSEPKELMVAGDVAVAVPVPERRSWLWRLLAYVGPDFGLVLMFTATLVILIASFGASFKWKEGPILISTGIGLGLVAIRFFWRAPAIVLDRPGERTEFRAAAYRILRDWGPIILVNFLFQSLETYTGVVRQSCIDDDLYRMDLALFGVEPTVWLSKFQTPLLTDLMAFFYGQYLITPMLLATVISL
ncbi:MAG: hypothetical protein HY901_24345, partial [Deltaproteobacteria bacterium]|nr:hypothetical protein [Deltaproteobacteria bacterium]